MELAGERVEECLGRKAQIQQMVSCVPLALQATWLYRPLGQSPIAVSLLL
jgi:hypothetical protein